MCALSPDEWRTVSPHIDKALEMTDEHRVAWLSGLRIQNPSVADQLEVVFSHYRSLVREGFLQGSVGLPIVGGLAGQKLGAYTLTSQIGAGGMASVWLAMRNDARFERNVAIKLLNMALIGRAGEDRFLREGLILGRLSHPNIAQLIDAGVTDTGQPYLVLEYVAGDQIDQYCDSRHLGIRARVRLLLEVLRAVEHAHSNSIVHRDLKPSNILVRDDGTVKLLDFGIAKMLHDEKQAGNLLTSDAGPALTPAYAAPEQLTGGPVTPATDVYALGALLYLLLAGRSPVTATGASHAEVFRMILEAEPSRPSDIGPPSLRRSLRGDLDTIALKALKKRPEERYESVAAFADDVRRYLESKPIRARPDTFPYRAGKFIHRHDRGIAAGLALTLLLITGARVQALRTAAPPDFVEQRVTANPKDAPVLDAVISPDGAQLAYTDRRGIHLQVVETGDVQDIFAPPALQHATGYWVLGGWSPDSSRLLASITIPEHPAQLWWISIHSREWVKIAEVIDMVGHPAVSRDGSMIAYRTCSTGRRAREIWLMNSRGGLPRRILTAEDGSVIEAVEWSPNGNRIAFIRSVERVDPPETSIESCDLNGGSRTTIVRDDYVAAMAWLPSERLLYSRATQRGRAGASELWEAAARGGSTRKMADWSGFFALGLSVTADGRRLVLLRNSHHTATLVGDLTSGGNGLANVRPLNEDDNINIVLAWTPDSRNIVFSSQRAATRQIFRQALASGSPQLITQAPESNFYMARYSPDGNSLLLEGAPTASRRMGLYRVSPEGGVPHLLFPVEGLSQYWCTNRGRNFCVIGTFAADTNELVIDLLNPESGVGRELMRIPLEPGSNGAVGFDYGWQLSPDGSRIGILKRHQHLIQVIPIDGRPSMDIVLKGHADLIDLNWAPDSRSLFVSSLEPEGANLLHSDLAGNTHLTWSQPQASWMWGIPSPDGNHLAISSEAAEANAWMLTNF